MNQDTETGERFTFPRRYRLTKTDEYSSVFGFRRAIKGETMLLHYGPSNAKQSSARLGLVIGKKQLKRAVDRNLLKRVAREVFRQTRQQLPNLDLILRLGTKLKKSHAKVVAAEVALLLGKLRGRVRNLSKEDQTG